MNLVSPVVVGRSTWTTHALEEQLEVKWGILTKRKNRAAARAFSRNECSAIVIMLEGCDRTDACGRPEKGFDTPDIGREAISHHLRRVRSFEGAATSETDLSV
jgi:hypothetical protein